MSVRYECIGVENRCKRDGGMFDERLGAQVERAEEELRACVRLIAAGRDNEDKVSRLLGQGRRRVLNVRVAGPQHVQAAELLLRLFADLPRTRAARQLHLRCTSLLADLAVLRDDHEAALGLHLRVCREAPDRPLPWSSAARSALKLGLCVGAGVEVVVGAHLTEMFDVGCPWRGAAVPAPWRWTLPPWQRGACWRRRMRT